MPGQAAAIKQMRAAGLEMPILAEEDVDGDFWKAAVPDVSEVYYTALGSIYGDDPDPKVNELVKRYQEAKGKKPESGTFLTGYAMIEAIAKAVEGTGGSTDGTQLQEQLETFNKEPLILSTTFGDKYHITLNRTLRIMEIQNGETSFVEEWAPKKTPLPAGE
jgi:branched-chain amino acid transport system substrate-binding protein